MHIDGHLKNRISYRYTLTVTFLCFIIFLTILYNFMHRAYLLTETVDAQTSSLPQ